MACTSQGVGLPPVGLDLLFRMAGALGCGLACCIALAAPYLGPLPGPPTTRLSLMGYVMPDVQQEAATAG